MFRISKIIPTATVNHLPTMKPLRPIQILAAILLCISGASCSVFQKSNSGDATGAYASDGGYNPYQGQPGQPGQPGQAGQPSYQQYQPSQQYAPQQQAPQQPYQTYTPSQPDYTPQPDYTAPPSKKRSSSAGGSYTVKQGDTLYRIALNHHTTVSRLKSTNGLTSDLIHPGQQLTLP